MIRLAGPKRSPLLFVLFSAVLLAPAAALAEEAAIDSGNTAWLLTSTALVLLMTIPGLALFYGGLVRSKNVLSILMQCFSMAALATVLWLICGYSLAFSGENPFIGNFSKAFLAGVDRDSLTGTIPESVFWTFQLTFAIITPALAIGAFAERMKFSAVMSFLCAWLLIVYVPVAHWVWGGGWLAALGALDFAGGTVVHINAGVAGLVACIVVGKRHGYPEVPMPPHSLVLTVVGAALLWVGWFGFNAGSALAADGAAGMAMLVTQVGSASAALAWMTAECLKHGKPSVLGIVTGAVGGLVAITPASGFVGPVGALIIGLVSGGICFYAATTVKRAFGYDDSLDAFGVHGVGGFVGAVLTGVFCAEGLGGYGFADGIDNIGKQVGVQFVGAAATVVYSALLSFVILKLIDATIGLRVDERAERDGLDITEHDERGYNP